MIELFLQNVIYMKNHFHKPGKEYSLLKQVLHVRSLCTVTHITYQADEFHNVYTFSSLAK